MPSRLTRAKRVKVESGEMALAPTVDHPRGFALRNRSGQMLIVSFEYDAATHVQTVVVEDDPRPARDVGSESREFPV